MAGVGALATVGATGQATATSNHVLGKITDPSGDDDGPGGYVYPVGEAGPDGSSEFIDGAYDMEEVMITDDDNAWTFTTSIGSRVNNPYGFDGGFSVQVFQMYVHDPDASDDQPASTMGRIGTNITFEDPYHYRVHVVGNGQAVEDASSPDPSEANVIEDSLNVSVNTNNNSISFSVPKSSIGGGSLEDKRIAFLLLPQDGFGTGGIRQAFVEDAGDETYTVGGAPGENQPHVFDMLDPEGVVDQSDALSYSSDAKASIPLFQVGNALEDATSEEDSDSTSRPTDVDGDGDSDADDVRWLLNERNSDTVQNNVSQYDYDNDGDVDISDVVQLYRRIF